MYVTHHQVVVERLDGRLTKVKDRYALLSESFLLGFRGHFVHLLFGRRIRRTGQVNLMSMNEKAQMMRLRRMSKNCLRWNFRRLTRRPGRMDRKYHWVRDADGKALPRRPGG